MTREEIIEMISNMYLKAVGAYQCCQKHGKTQNLPLLRRDIIICDRILTQIENAEKKAG